MSETLEFAAAHAQADAAPVAEHQRLTCAGSLDPEAQSLAIPESSGSALPTGAPLSTNLALFDSIAVQADVVLGHANLDLGTLLRLRDGDLIETDRQVQHPVDVRVNGNIIARGELVAVGDRFGVRITQVAARVGP